MIPTPARATPGPRQPFVPVVIQRRVPGPRDVVIDVKYAGICHSDIHHAYDDFGATMFPLVPGHEIAGVVSAVGSKVARFAVGDHVGVGPMVDSCRKCDSCRAGLEQFCRKGDVKTNNGRDYDGRPTDGGYSALIVVDEHFVLKVPSGVPLETAAPLLCAGLSVYSPMRTWGVGPGTRLALVGFGGLGHLAVQYSKAMGAHTTVLDLSEDKRADALRLGADAFVQPSDAEAMQALTDSFDVVISMVPSNPDIDGYLRILDVDGTLVLIGVPGEPVSFNMLSLMRHRRRIVGTLIAGIQETQEMLDFSGAHGVHAEVEVVSADEIDVAYERVMTGDVRYRFVIDGASMK